MSAQQDLEEAVEEVDPSKPSTHQLRPLEKWLGGLVDVEASEVYAISVSRTKNLVKQAGQSERGRVARVLVVVLTDSKDVQAIVKALPKLIGNGRFEAAVVVVIQPGLAATVAAAVQAAGNDRLDALAQAFPQAQITGVQPGYTGKSMSAYGAVVTAQTPAITSDSQKPFTPPAPSQMVPEPRVWRMITASVASAPAVMLVGPPGTGKSTLVSDVIASVFADPSRFAMAGPPSGVDTHTPDEGWDTRTLIGGETVDDQGRLRFRAGRLLEAIREDRWLILDEANRADLDRILGPALTWLAGGDVSLGTASNALDAAEVRLEWDLDAPSSHCIGWERLEEGTGAPIRFVANASWRLLGTYNAVDAQRVFRFGQALGRRFQRVPVPAAGSVEFAAALFEAMPELPDGLDPTDLAGRIERLYAAHRDGDSPLGPAVFLRIPGYVQAAAQHMDAAAAQATAGALLTEAYVLAAGGSLVHLEPDELEAFGAPLVAAGVLEADQWAWAARAIQALS